MKNLWNNILLIISVLVLSACEKNQDGAELYPEILITNPETNGCFQLRKYDEQDRLLFRQNTCINSTYFTYLYDDDSIIPIQLEKKPLESLDPLVVVDFHYSPPILTAIENEFIFTGITKYVLDNDLKVLYIIKFRDDTIAFFNYENQLLKSIKYSQGETDTFIYNDNNQLIKKENNLNSALNYTYTYSNGKLSSFSTPLKTVSYKYCSGVLCEITTSNFSYFVAASFLQDLPAELDPINIFVYPYLELDLMGQSLF